MYPKDVPDLVSCQSNRNSLDNSYVVLKKFRPSLAGGNKRCVKPGSNIKADKTHEDWYLACEAYRKLASQDIKIKRSSFLKYIHYASCFTSTKSEEQYFGRFLVKIGDGQLEASAVV